MAGYSYLKKNKVYLLSVYSLNIRSTLVASSETVTGVTGSWWSPHSSGKGPRSRGGAGEAAAAAAALGRAREHPTCSGTRYSRGRVHRPFHLCRHHTAGLRALLLLPTSALRLLLVFLSQPSCPQVPAAVTSSSAGTP